MPMINSPIKIVGFTPLGVILAERLSYSYSDVSLVEQTLTISRDNHWQSVSLLCLMNLLKECRKLLTNESKKFCINIQNMKINEEILYTYLKLTTERIQKYYLTLLKQRRVKLELFNDQIKKDVKVKESSLNREKLMDNDDPQCVSKMRPWQSYFHSSTTIENCLTYVTYGQCSYADFKQSPRLNAFHAIFQNLLHEPSIKLIGPNIFAFELAHLFSSLSQHQVRFYRMNPEETFIIPLTKTNNSLITLFQNFSKSIHSPLIQTIVDEKNLSTLQIIEQFHQFRINIHDEGRLEYKSLIELTIPMGPTTDEIKKNKRTYLDAFRESIHESTIKLKPSNIHTDEQNNATEEPLDHFQLSSTFFVLPDAVDLNHSMEELSSSSLTPFPKAIRTFHSTPGSLVLNIYETLRTISNDESILHLKNIFLSTNHELCVLENPLNEYGVYGADQIIGSEQHSLQRSIENPHDFYRIIHHSVDQCDQVKLSESQLFLNDALDLQSLILLFNSQQIISKNELMFLFHNEYDWHHLLILPDCLTVKK